MTTEQLVDENEAIVAETPADAEKSAEALTCEAGEEKRAAASAEGHPSAPKRLHRLIRVRTLVTAAVFCLIVIGLIVGGGWGTLSSFGFTEIAYLCPVGALEALAASHLLIPRIVIALVVVLLAVVLLGRFFCGWICPVPPLQRLFRGSGKRSSGSKKDASKTDGDADDGADASTDAAPAAARGHACSHGGCAGCHSAALPPVGGERNGLQIDSRHGVLLGAVASAAVFGFPVFCLVCPVGLSIAFVIGIYRAIFEQNPTVSILIFAAILLVEVVFFRKWCHRFCPIGALLSLVGAKSPLLKPRVDESKCLRGKGIDCHVCVEVCPEELDPHSKKLSECSRCGMCIDACPVGAIGFKGGRKSAGIEPASDATAEPVPALAVAEEERA